MLSIVYNKALNERLGKGCPVALCPSRADRPVSGHSPGVRSAACFLIRLGQACCLGSTSVHTGFEDSPASTCPYSPSSDPREPGKA